MTLNLNSLLIGSEHPDRLVDFYNGVLQKEPDWTGDIGEFSGYQIGNCMLIIGPHSEVKGDSQEPQRIIINFETEDVEGEYKRIKGLGAEEIKAPYHPGEDPKMWIATLADPDGNYFQLASPMTE